VAMRPPPSASSPLAPFADARKPKVSWAETAGEEGGIRLPKPDEGVHVPLRSLNPHRAEVPMDPARRSLGTGKSRPERFPRGVRICHFWVRGAAEEGEVGFDAWCAYGGAGFPGEGC